MAQGRKTGGRVAGTPNKVSSTVRGAIDPKDRVAAMEKFTAYVAPKLQTTTLDVATETKKTIEDKLVELAGDEEDDEE